MSFDPDDPNCCTDDDDADTSSFVILPIVLAVGLFFSVVSCYIRYMCFRNRTVYVQTCEVRQALVYQIEEDPNRTSEIQTPPSYEATSNSSPPAYTSDRIAQTYKYDRLP